MPWGEETTLEWKGGTRRDDALARNDASFGQLRDSLSLSARTDLFASVLTKIGNGSILNFIDFLIGNVFLCVYFGNNKIIALLSKI